MNKIEEDLSSALGPIKRLSIQKVLKRIRDLSDQKWLSLLPETKCWFNANIERMDKQQDVVHWDDFDPYNEQLITDDIDVGLSYKFILDNRKDPIIGEVVSMGDTKITVLVSEGKSEVVIVAHLKEIFLMPTQPNADAVIAQNVKDAVQSSSKAPAEKPAKPSKEPKPVEKEPAQRDSAILVARQIICAFPRDDEKQIAKRLSEKGYTLKTLPNVYRDTHIILGILESLGKSID